MPEQKNVEVKQSDIESLFGASSTSIFRDGNAMRHLQERQRVQSESQVQAEKIRADLEDDQTFFDDLNEIKVALGEGTGAARIGFGKFVSKIPVVGATLRRKFDKAKWEHILLVQLKRYQAYHEDLSRKLGKGAGEGTTLEEYINEVRKEADNALANIKKASENVQKGEKDILNAKAAFRDLVIGRLPRERGEYYVALNPRDIDTRALEGEAIAAAPDIKTPEGIDFREKISVASRKLRDLQSELVKSSSELNRMDSLLRFYQYEEDAWGMMKEAAERTFDVIEATIDSREQLIRASIEATTMDTVIASAIKQGEQLKEHTSTYLLLQAKLAQATVRAARVQSTDIVDIEKLEQAQEIMDGLQRDKTALNTREYKNAKETILVGAVDNHDRARKVRKERAAESAKK